MEGIKLRDLKKEKTLAKFLFRLWRHESPIH